MPENSETSRRLLEIAQKTYRSENLEELSGSKRYMAAMVANAMDIAARALEHEEPAGHLAGLMENAGADGSAGLTELARAIREGRISAATHPDLHETLLAYVRAKLEISNPRFLKQRRS